MEALLKINKVMSAAILGVDTTDIDSTQSSDSYSHEKEDYYNAKVVKAVRGVLVGIFCFVFLCSVIGTVVGIRVKRPLRVVITILIDLLCIMRCLLQLVPWFHKEEEDKHAIEYSLICDLLYLIMALVLIVHIFIQERKDSKIKGMIINDNKLSIRQYFNLSNDDDDTNMLYSFKRKSEFCCCSNNVVVPFICIILMGLALLVCTIIDAYDYFTINVGYIDQVCGLRTICVGFCVFVFSAICFALSIVYRNGSNRFALVCLMCFVKGILTLAAFTVTAKYVHVTRYERFWIESVYAVVSEAVPILGLLIAFLGIDLYNSSEKAHQIDYDDPVFYVGDD